MASTGGSDRCSSLFDLVKNDISASKKEGIARHLKLLEDREASEGNGNYLALSFGFLAVSD